MSKSRKPSFIGGRLSFSWRAVHDVGCYAYRPFRPPRHALSTLSSIPSETEKEVTAANIRSVKVNYRPGKRIIDTMKNVPKEKVK